MQGVLCAITGLAFGLAAGRLVDDKIFTGLVTAGVFLALMLLTDERDRRSKP